MKTLYIAAPFFNEDELKRVIAVERMIRSVPGLQYYSPRSDGVLKDMTPEERKAAAPKIFALNVQKINECAGMVAILDTSDTGTSWELGYAYGKRPIIAYTSGGKTLNVMLRQCVNAHAHEGVELMQWLQAFERGEALVATAAVGDTY